MKKIVTGIMKESARETAYTVAIAGVGLGIYEGGVYAKNTAMSFFNDTCDKPRTDTAQTPVLR